MRTIFIICILIAAPVVVQAQVDTVLNRYRDHLFQTANTKQPGIEKWVESMTAEGQWPDINYKDTERANWKVSHHLRRVEQVALAWANPESVYHNKREVLNIALRGLDHWLDKRYRNSNWWHNQIGVPQYMRDIIILLEGQLTPEQRQGALEVLAQHHVLGNGAGANLIWSADLGFHYGALTNDLALMKKCRDLLVNEIMISTGEGVQPDYSYHQHGNRLQMYQYGRAYLVDNIRIAWQVNGTPLEFPAEKVDILTGFILKGWQWMARGVNTVPGTMDRSVSREGELKSADIREIVPLLCDLRAEKTAVFKALAARQNGRGSLVGYRYFPYSDFSAYHHEDFSFFLKTISDRTLATESINSENLKGHLLNSGDAHLIRDGEEYYNLMPVWDWEKLPGVTGFKGADHINRKAFVGSVSDGSSGLTVMDYQLSNEEGTKSLSAHKFWAAHENVVVCLMADLQTNNIDGKIYTALDQCRWRGDVAVNEPGNILPEGIHDLKEVKWVYHAGFAYIPVAPAAFDIHLEERTGAWSEINTAQSAIPVKEKVFMPVMKHNVSAEDRTAGYVLAASPSVRKTKKLARDPAWEIIRNGETCQAVAFEDGTVMAAFFSPDQLTIDKEVLSVDQPCLVMISGGQLYISDPAQTGEGVNISWKGNAWNIQLDKEGFTRTITFD